MAEVNKNNITIDKLTEELSYMTKKTKKYQEVLDVLADNDVSFYEFKMVVVYKAYGSDKNPKDEVQLSSEISDDIIKIIKEYYSRKVTVLEGLRALIVKKYIKNNRGLIKSYIKQIEEGSAKE